VTEPHDNKKLVRRLIDEVWNAGDVAALAELWSEETSAEALGLHQLLTSAFPDLRVQIDDLIAEADRVAARLTFTGTHRGDFRGIAPTGRPVRFDAIRIYRIVQGKIAETWASQDALGLLQQLGAVPRR
jgi:ketosteroid isomerase-like protein